MSTSTDVVVTGLGATTPLGGDVAGTWDALLAGRSGVSRITDDWAKDFPAQLVARLAADPSEQIDRVRARRLDRSQQVAVVAAEEAWRHSGAADAGAAPERIAVVFGTGIGGGLTLPGQGDRESVGEGKSVDFGGRRIIKKKKISMSCGLTINDILV